MIGKHDKDADERANVAYFHRRPRSKEKLGLDYDDPDMGLTAFAAPKPHPFPDAETNWERDGDPYEPKVLIQAKPKKNEWLEAVRAVSDQDTKDELAFWEKACPDFDLALYAVYDSARDLCLKKHKDYGPKNIADAPGGALNGLRVRMHDKLARINHLIDSGATPENESLKDSFVDLLNYSAIAIMVLNGDWPQ